MGSEAAMASVFDVDDVDVADIMYGWIDDDDNNNNNNYYYYYYNDNNDNLAQRSCQSKMYPALQDERLRMERTTTRTGSTSFRFYQ